MQDALVMNLSLTWRLFYLFDSWSHLYVDFRGIPQIQAVCLLPAPLSFLKLRILLHMGGNPISSYGKSSPPNSLNLGILSYGKSIDHTFIHQRLILTDLLILVSAEDGVNLFYLIEPIFGSQLINDLVIVRFFISVPRRPSWEIIVLYLQGCHSILDHPHRLLQAVLSLLLIVIVSLRNHRLYLTALHKILRTLALNDYLGILLPYTSKVRVSR